MGDGPAPIELEVSRLCEKYGAQAIVGSVLPVSLARRMIAAENVANWTAAWREGGAEWANENPDHMAVVAEIARLNA